MRTPQPLPSPPPIDPDGGDAPAANDNQPVEDEPVQLKWGWRRSYQKPPSPTTCACTVLNVEHWRSDAAKDPRHSDWAKQPLAHGSIPASLRFSSRVPNNSVL